MISRKENVFIWLFSAQLIRRAQNKKYVIDSPKPEKEQASVFTEEDFAKFEREYFVGWSFQIL